MRNSAKKWLIAAAFLAAFGAILFAGAMTAYHWDFSRLSTDQPETNTYEISEEFTDIKLNVDTADILFGVSDDNLCRVVCYEQENLRHSVGVSDGSLTVTAEDNREWYEYIGIHLHSPSVTVYLPKDKAAYGSLDITGSTGNVSLPEGSVFGSIGIRLSTGDVDCRASTPGLLLVKTSTGDINLSGLSAGELDLTVSTGRMDVRSVVCEGHAGISVSTGKVDLTDVSCGSLGSVGSTGDISMKNVIAAETISLERSTGDVRFEQCDAGGLTIETDTGDVTGSLLTDKVFLTETDTGKADVPKTTAGGKCEIRTDTGDICVKIGE